MDPEDTSWPDSPAEWHPQDWLLICEALRRYADRRLDVNARGARARELAAAIAVDQDLRPTEIHHHADQRWP